MTPCPCCAEHLETIRALGETCDRLVRERERERLRAALTEAADELDACYTAEYPTHYPHHVRKLATAKSANPARALRAHTAQPAAVLAGAIPIASAPTDGTEVVVYVAARDGLPAFITKCAYHPDAGWCADELREVTHYFPHIYLPPAASVLEPTDEMVEAFLGAEVLYDARSKDMRRTETRARLSAALAAAPRACVPEG